MKIGIVGAGKVGCACAMAAVIRGIAREIVLANRTRKTAQAVARHGYTDKGRAERGIERELYFTEPPDFHIFLRYPPYRLNSSTRSLKVSTLPIPEGKRLARDFASSD